MHTPQNFQLPIPFPLDCHPFPELPKYLKHQVYDNPEAFAKVDEHAMQVARCEHPAFRDLMWDLVFRYKLDELERTRVIFRWLSAKDMMNITFQSAPPNSPEEVLLSFKHSRGTFARIFEVMCSYAGIHCITISGYAKGVDYLPGDRFSGLPPNHSWNAVYIRGSWQLIDAHWAARYLSSGKNVPENVVYEFDDFYFIMEPQQAVYSHFPEDQRWQLLPIPLTLMQFESLPLTKSQFFKCGIDFLDQHHGVVYTQDGRLRMTLGFWRPGGFTYKLQYLLSSANHPQPDSLIAYPSDLHDQVPDIDVDLKNFLLQETTKDCLNYYFRLPASGVYYLTIYAQELSSLNIGRESTFRAACEYKIVCDAPAVDSHAYPVCHDANWGPAWVHVQHYALEPSHTDGVITVESTNQFAAGYSPTTGRGLPLPASLNIRFGKNRPEVNLLAKLHCNGVSDDYLDQYQHISETVKETVFHVNLPEPGEYGLEVYANEPNDGDTYTHMCQYLLHYEPPPAVRRSSDHKWQSSIGRGRLTVSGGDAGPSPDFLGAGRGRTAVGNGHRSPGTDGVAVKNVGSLRDMYNYELHAPPMGHLPRPYATSQYSGDHSTTTAQAIPGTALRQQYRPGPENDLPSPPPQSTLLADGRRHQGDTFDSGQYRSPNNEPVNSTADLTHGFSRIRLKPESGDHLTRDLKEERSNQLSSSTKINQQNMGEPNYARTNSFANPLNNVQSPEYSHSDAHTFSTAYGRSPFKKGSPFTSGSTVPGPPPPGYQQYDHLSSTGGGGGGGKALSRTAPTLAHYRPDQSTANWSTGPIQREPPKEFSLTPLATDQLTEKPLPQELPSVADNAHAGTGGGGPTYNSFEMFRRVDEHAMSVSQLQQDNFNQLIWQLIYARNITDELEKVRVIFLWLCTKDLHKMNFDNVKPDSPEDILTGIRTGKSTYAQIFHTLCRYAGLHCKLLIGYAKGADYTPGMRFVGSQGQHSWNAVSVDKVWRLVDCHWAARRLIGKRPSPENVRYGLDMFYFLANPGQLIYTHFPHDSDWQLLRHPISLKEFENLAPVKSAFFKYNLDLVTHRNAVITCTEPEVCVVIACPGQNASQIAFTFGLSFDNKEGSEEFHGVPLSRYGRQEFVPRERKSLFYVRPPRSGAYKLLIYAKLQHGDTAGSLSQLDNASLVSDPATDVASGGGGGSLEGNMYGAVCEYRLVTHFASNCCLPPYPPCQSSSYGPNELSRNYGVQALTTETTVYATRGCLELRFSLDHSISPPPRLMGKLRCTLVQEEALSRSILQRSLPSSREVVFAIFLPESGEYGFEVYANNPASEGNSFYVIWQYLILSDSECPVRGLPTIPPAYLGPMPLFDSMGLTTVSHPDPFVQAKTGELCIQLNQAANFPLRVMAQLIHASHDVAEDCSHQILQQTRGNQLYFLIRFPHQGFFKFQIYALPCSQAGESLPNIFNYLLEATQVHRNRFGQVMCFPQQFAQWKEGCYLHFPLDGILTPTTVTPTVTSVANTGGVSSPGVSVPTSTTSGGDFISFRVTVPAAIAVAVVVGDDWTHLVRVGDHWWEGQVPMRSHWARETQLAVCANSTTPDGNYGTLLEYQLRKR